MATAQAIAQAIHNRVNQAPSPSYTAWRIGLTHDPEERRKSWHEPKYFTHWKADSLEEAQKVETYFINEKKMKGGTGGNLSPYKTTYVYIF
tara:strand:- start:353 stop:625 length:273 start_codon:yes stop_codon:yes gene_type:complete